MTQVVRLDEIKQALKRIDVQELMRRIEVGFVAYSKKEVVVPPVGHLGFQNPPGDTHIKYGYIKNHKYYVVKIASSFYENPKIGLSSSNGAMLVFSQKTGELLAVLLDEGYLTDIRTAVAGAVVAKHMAPANVHAIGIVGTGIQARLQLRYLKTVLSCRKVYVFGRSGEKLQEYKAEMEPDGFEIVATQSIEDITNNCNYIVTTTPSTKPLIMSVHIKAGVHITAMGADAKGKQELDPHIVQRADMVVADSISQCVDHGEISYAVENKLLGLEKIKELGAFIEAGKKRAHDEELTVADLTGVAVQDIQIATAVYDELRSDSVDARI